MEYDSTRLYVDVQYRPELITGITAAAGRAVPAGAIRVSPRRRAVRYLAGRVNRELPDQAIREIFTMSYIVNNCPFLI